MWIKSVQCGIWWCELSISWLCRQQVNSLWTGIWRCEVAQGQAALLLSCNSVECDFKIWTDFCTISFNVTDIQSNRLNLRSHFKLHILYLYVWWLTDVVRALLLCVPALLAQWSGSLIWKKIKGISICLPQQNDWIATLWTGVGFSWPIQTGGHISFPLTDMLKVQGPPVNWAIFKC